jgi:hypothetical protein
VVVVVCFSLLKVAHLIMRGITLMHYSLFKFTLLLNSVLFKFLSVILDTFLCSSLS